MPETSFLEVRDGAHDPVYFTILRDSAHTNVAQLFGEDKRRRPEEDQLTVLRGFVGAYPNALFSVERTELASFVESVCKLEGEPGYAALRSQFGVRRTNPAFWELSDRLHEASRAYTPLTAGLFDYNRLADRPEPLERVLAGAGRRYGAWAHLLGLAIGHVWPQAQSMERPRRLALDRPRAAPPQLPAVLRRPEHLAHRHLDDARRDELAGLPADRLGAPARPRRLRRADPDVPARAVRRRAGRSLEPPPRARRHAGARDAAVGGARVRSRSPARITVLARARAQRSSRASSTRSTCRRARRSSSRWSTTARTCRTRSRSTRRWSTPRACSARRSPACSSPRSARAGASLIDARQLPRGDRLAAR